MGNAGTVIIVDDDETLLRLVRETLSMNGYKCKTAPNGRAALELMSTCGFDFMITDIVMPGMSGFELTEEVKRRSPKTEVIMMTGFSEEDSCSRAIKAGASDFITKPFSLEELLVRIERVKKNSLLLSEIRKHEEELKTVSREMIAGVKDESSKMRTALEDEISRLKKNLSENTAA